MWIIKVFKYNSQRLYVLYTMGRTDYKEATIHENESTIFMHLFSSSIVVFVHDIMQCCSIDGLLFQILHIVCFVNCLAHHEAVIIECGHLEPLSRPIPRAHKRAVPLEFLSTAHNNLGGPAIYSHKIATFRPVRGALLNHPTLQAYFLPENDVQTKF